MPMSPRIKAKKGRFGAGGLAPSLTAAVDIVTGQAAVDTFTFTGSAADAESGDLTASITWTSDQDGLLGTGGSVATTLTAVGAHVITVSVTDGTNTTTQTINVSTTA